MDNLEHIAAVDQLFVKQRFKLIGNEYDISLLNEAGSGPGSPVCYVRQKKMKIKEEINFFADESQTQKILSLKKRNVLELRGTTDVRLPDGTVIGALRKEFGKSLLRSTWQILDANQNVVAIAQEKSMAMALLRRFGELLPFGEIAAMFPYHFDILVGGNVVGTYSRPATGLTDRYILDLKGDTERRIDRRVAMAFTIALDALQDR